MKKILFTILPILLWTLAFPSLVSSQEEPSKAYFIEEDDVVFVFDIRDYERATDEGSQEELDFENLDIYKVAVTGDFLLWSREGWKMEKTGQFTYQLRKPLADFDQPFPIAFKYIINDQYWAEPGKTFPTTRKFSNDFFEETYNLTLYDVLPSIEGNTFFFLEGFEGANEVILTGTFVQWDEGFLKMQKVPGGWLMRLDLKPDRYEYKFIVDGEWHHDFANPNMVGNEHGSFNSVLQVAKTMRFELEGFSDATQVSIVTSLNYWSQQPMVKTPSGWAIDVPMPGGKHHYKFVVDGRYMTDPGNPLIERNNKGMAFSVKIVQ